MKLMRMMVLAGLLLAMGCETYYRGWRADFANASQYAVDVYRNGNLKFTLPPNADGDCRLDLDDDFAVLDHDTGQVLGSFHVDAWGGVYDVRVFAVIYDDHVDWSTDFGADDW
jgi:hypothetical protein